MFFAKGLRMSGFRVDELRRLSWDTDQLLSIDQTHEVTLVKMFAEGHKSRRDTYQPITKEFWDLIDRRGISRRGLVFPLHGQRGLLTNNSVVRVISKICKRAGIVTGQDGKTATSHDIGRRMFLTHIAATEGLSTAQQWARHADPRTTASYYVSHDAVKLAKQAGW